MPRCIECQREMDPFEAQWSYMCPKCRAGRPASEWRVPRYTDGRRKRGKRGVLGRALKGFLDESDRDGMHIEGTDDDYS